MLYSLFDHLFIAEQNQLTKEKPIQELLDRVFKDNEDGKRTLLKFLKNDNLDGKTIGKVAYLLKGTAAKDMKKAGVKLGDAGDFLDSLGIYFPHPRFSFLYFLISPCIAY